MTKLNSLISKFEAADEAKKEEKFAELVQQLYTFSTEKVKEYKLLQEYWKFVYRVACNLALPHSHEHEEGRVNKVVNPTRITMWRTKNQKGYFYLENLEYAGEISFSEKD